MKAFPSWLAGGLILGTLAAAMAFHLVRVKPAVPPPKSAVGHEVDPAAADRAAGRVPELRRRLTADPAGSVDALATALRAVGAEVIDVPLRIVQPRTLRAALRGADGADLGIAVHPMAPNGLQPVVTPEGGLHGRLMVVSSARLGSAPRFDGHIAVVDTANPPRELDLSWERYAALGFAAMVVTHPDGIQAIDWAKTYSGMVTPAPINFPRAVADPGILAHDGAEVVLDLAQDLRSRNRRGLVARLSAAQPTDEAVVVVATADQVRAVLDLPADPVQDIGAAWTLAVAELLAADPAARRRDVLVVVAEGAAQAQDGLAQIAAAAGPLGSKNDAVRARRSAERNALATERAILAEAQTRATSLFSDPAAALAGPAGQALRREFAAVLGDDALAAADRATLAAINLARTPGDKVAGQALIEAKRAESKANLLATLEAEAAVRRYAALLAEQQIPGRLTARFTARLAEFDRSLAQAETAVRIAALTGRYQRAAVIGVQGIAGKRLAWHTSETPRATTQAFIDWLTEAAGDAEAGSLLLPDRNYGGLAGGAIAGMITPTNPWSILGWSAATLVDADASTLASRSSWPGAAAPGDPSLQLRLATRVVQRLTAGYGNLPTPHNPLLLSVGGRVLAGGIGGSLVPTHPVADAIVSDKPRGWFWTGGMAAGMIRVPMIETALDGTYGRNDAPASLRSSSAQTGWSPSAAVYDRDGLIVRHSDEGLRVQSVAKSLDLGRDERQFGVDLVAFRCTPLSVLDRIDPRTLKPWSVIELARVQGLTALEKMARYQDLAGPAVWMVPPAERLAVLFKTGSEDNEQAVQTASFVLGDDGAGLVPADSPFITSTALRAAGSLAKINGDRLAVAGAAGLADTRMTGFHQENLDRLAAAKADSGTDRARLLAARDASTYGQIVYRELRGAVSSAVSSIVWYLFLLVPFALFLERLAFGFADVRKALVASATIFLATFVILGLLHPAFRLVGSPAMILLGFAILLISLGVSVLFLARAKENLAAIERRRGMVDAAKVDVFGVLGTAVALGINGLSRRKVRTGLTCATLVLMTFCLIAFISTRNNLIDTSVPTGVAPYQGFIARGLEGRSLTTDEISALQVRYGLQHPVIIRRTMMGWVNFWDMSAHCPRPVLVLGEGEGRREAGATGLLSWDNVDPLLGRVKWLAGGLTRDGLDTQVRAVAVPDEIARNLGIDPGRFAAPVPVTLSGQALAVTGIFDSNSLRTVRDLDGRPVLPVDLAAMAKMRQGKDGGVLLSDNDPLMDPAKVLITDQSGSDPPVADGGYRISSCAVVLDGLGYKEARALVNTRLEQTGAMISYGLGGIAYTGRKARSGGLGGLSELIIPLLIAGLTVLNTMRGSVYERRDEIAVYNAVGIAPRFISAMFFAEALVFAVVGVVLGYLLALAVGRGLGVMGWDTGLKIDYVSMTPVWASLALAAAVFISTWFPARAAAEIAAPSDDAGWTVPAPDGDRLSFALPFAFSARDRVAVLAFFHRVFIDHGEGGAGPFQCGTPQVSVSGSADGPVALVVCPVWLKPFDLGVAQELEIALRPDAETGEWLAHLTLSRGTGTREAWLRLNQGFIASLRRRFLFWRAVDESTRAELHAEAVSLLRGEHV